ncbi:Zinc finger, C2HC5-type [Penicillium camemberti]|uniref:Zinc finger, C2HC5-type n=1 Tax=Penicillium camemberti (strain FM 013) TaxID=1429867 RepID=A0A0G4NW47_PENC3|nr:Zinc finger, C2HC5-type [Penicillium camemberti]
MSNMADLKAWAAPRLSQLLPLDPDSLSQVIDYAVSLSREACADHLKNLLGDSPAALEFISSFNSRREPQRPPQNPPTQSRDAPRSSGGAKKGKKKAPLHTAGPPRRPDNYGDVGGGYKKADEEDYMSSRKPAAPTLAPSPHASSASSRIPSPLPASSPKPPPSASGPTISDMLPNVRSKVSKSTRQGGGAGSSSKGNTALTTNDISDLTAAIAALEVSTNPSLGERRSCTCYGSLHPVFDPAPNCLNCGKIICSLEGLQPCSFCGTPLLSAEEVQGMIRELRAERGQEKMRVHNEGVHHEGVPKPTAGSEPSSKLDAAKAHRDKLLQFQAQNARRTKVVDETADFETPNVASTLWMTPTQRALALKKQQRIQREMDEKARPEWERKKTVMSLDIKGGKVRRVYHSAPAEPTPEASEPEPVAEGGAEDSPRGQHAFSRNPLLAAGGLMRPVWRAPEIKQAEPAEQTERKQTWRRVQDDNDDNEQWILDGGILGHAT